MTGKLHIPALIKLAVPLSEIMREPPTSSPPPSTSRSSSVSSSSLPRTPPNLHQNTIDPDAKWLVQKFGGTSVGKFATKIAEDIVACVAKLRCFTILLNSYAEIASTNIRSPSCVQRDPARPRRWALPTSSCVPPKKLSSAQVALQVQVPRDI